MPSFKVLFLSEDALHLQIPLCIVGSGGVHTCDVAWSVIMTADAHCSAKHGSLKCQVSLSLSLSLSVYLSLSLSLSLSAFFFLPPLVCVLVWCVCWSVCWSGLCVGLVCISVVCVCWSGVCVGLCVGLVWSGVGEDSLCKPVCEHVEQELSLGVVERQLPPSQSSCPPDPPQGGGTGSAW